MNRFLLFVLFAAVATPGCSAHLRAMDPRTNGDSAAFSPSAPVFAFLDPASERDLALNGRLDPSEGVRRRLSVDREPTFPVAWATSLSGELPTWRLRGDFAAL